MITSLRHGWGWQPPQTASGIHIRDLQSVWAHLYAVHGHTFTLAALNNYTHLCGVEMMSLRHGWGWQSPQNASCIHIRALQSVWAHWYAVYGHTVADLHSYTHPTWLRSWTFLLVIWTLVFWHTHLPSVIFAHGPAIISYQHQHCTTTRAQSSFYSLHPPIELNGCLTT
jgi:hypothetical protein